MRKKILLLAVLVVASATTIDAQRKFPFFWKKKKTKTEQTTPAKKESEYDKLFKKKHETAKGLITLHLLDGKVYFELPVDLINKDMLIGSTVTSISDNGNAVVGSKPTDLLHVMFTRNKTHVQLRQVNTDYITGNTKIDEALRKSTLGAILSNQKIQAYNNDSTAIIFDMSSVFLGDNKKMSPFDKNSIYGMYNRTENYQSDCSYISQIKAFKDNVSIKSCLSYTFSVSNSQGTSLIKDRPFTAEMTRSIMLLKEKPYRPRMADYRIGVFFTGREQLGEGAKTTAPVYYANRWDIQPSDTAAYLRGEKVKPTKQIVFYIDNTFPEKWKPYLREGVTQWNELFEQIGFKDVVVAKDFPTDDPEFDPDNIKYSCVRYAPSSIENAMGPSWVDPRSGEILNASVYLYHNVIKLISNWLFVQTAQADKDVRTVNIPDEMVGDALRYVLSHEIGHCLGFMHNMGASSTFPVDSLRSPEFTQKYGTTPSIMDYARFNYVAQPGDKERGVKLTPPRFGEYDKYLIKWTYTPVFNVNTVDEEAVITGKWITDAIKENPVYRYGKQQVYGVVDPRSQTEDIGDNSMKATRYGIKNLKYIMNNLENWISEDDDTYEYREDLFIGIVEQLAMYVTHVAGNVGGYFVNEVKEGDTMPRFAQIPKAQQKEALNYLFEIYNDLDWLDNKNLLTKFPVSGSPKQTIQNFMLRYILPVPFQVSQYEGLEKDSFTAAEAFNMIYNFVWKPTISGRTLTESQMNLQKQYIYMMMQTAGFTIKGAGKALAGEKLLDINHRQFGYTCCQGHAIKEGVMHNPVAGFEWKPLNRFSMTAKVTQADVYAYIAKAKQLMKQKAASASGKTKAHYELLLKMLDINLK